MGPIPFAYGTQLPGATTVYLDVGLQVSWPTKLTVSVVIDPKFRAERKKSRICSDIEYQKSFHRLRQLPQTVEHVIVQLGTLAFAILTPRDDERINCTGVPIAYPRMVFLESALDSKFNPLIHLGRKGSFGLSGFVNKFNAEAELLDDLVGPA